MRIIIGITGASGIIYAKQLLESLNKAENEITLIATPTAKLIAEKEIEGGIETFKNFCHHYYESSQLDAPPASGSQIYHAMIIIPCSMKTLASISHGIADNLITRAADVTLKEGRKLILVIRETPLNLIHIKNMLEAAEAGAIIMPASPAFYHKPKTIEELTAFITAKILNLLGIPQEILKPYKAEEMSKP